MLTSELSSYVGLLEIPNDAYTILSQNLIGYSTLSQEYCKLIGCLWKIMRHQLWTLACPFPYINKCFIKCIVRSGHNNDGFPIFKLCKHIFNLEVKLQTCEYIRSAFIYNSVQGGIQKKGLFHTNFQAAKQPWIFVWDIIVQVWIYGFLTAWQKSLLIWST